MTKDARGATAVPHGLASQNPRFVEVFSRDPIGPWDSLPTAIVAVPVVLRDMTDSEELQRARELVTDYCVSTTDAAMHARRENTAKPAMPSQAEIDAVEASAVPLRTGQEDRYIASSRSTRERMDRLKEVARSLESRAVTAREDAVNDLILRTRAVVNDWRCNARVIYTADTTAIQSVWLNKRPTKKKDADGLLVLAPPPAVINVDYCIEQSAAIGAGPVPKKVSGLIEIQYRSAVCAAIIGAYVQEAARLKLESEFRNRVEIRKIHRQLLSHISTRAEIQGQKWHYTASVVLASCPRWMEMRRTGKINIASENLFLKYETFWMWMETAMIKADLAGVE